MPPNTRIATASRLSFDDDFGAASPSQTLSAAWQLVTRHWKLLVAIPLVIAFAAGIYGLIRPRTFTSAASFMGSTSDVSRSGLSSLVSQFGLRVPMTDAGESPQFYADLLRSREVLDSVVQTRFAYHDVHGARRDETLLDAFHVSGSPRPVRVENAMAALDRATNVSVGTETGVVNVSVATTSPELSMQIVARYLQLINAFNLETRQSRAKAEREFTETRMADAGAQLHAAEDQLAAFRRQNHSFGSSSELVVEEDRLQRAVMMRSQLYSAIAQAYEQARVDEVRDTPVITTVGAPYLPARPDSRGLLRRVILGGVIGALLAIGLAVIIDLRSTSGALLASAEASA